MASRYSTSIRTRGVVPRYLFALRRSAVLIWVLGFSLYCVGSSILLHVQWAGIFSVVLTSLPVWRSFVVQECRSNYNFTGIILSKNGLGISHRTRILYEDDERTMSCLQTEWRLAPHSIKAGKCRGQGMGLRCGVARVSVCIFVTASGEILASLSVSRRTLSDLR